MIHHIKKEDIVEVQPSMCSSQYHLEYKKGVVIQSFAFKMAIVQFDTALITTVADSREVIKSNTWLVHWDNLKVLDSPQDERFTILENEIVDLEDSLYSARALLAVSEQLRDMQRELIENLLKDLGRSNDKDQ